LCATCHEASRPTTSVNGYVHQLTSPKPDCKGCHTRVPTTANPNVTDWSGGMISHTPVPASCNECHSADRASTRNFPENAPNKNNHYTMIFDQYRTGAANSVVNYDCVECHQPVIVNDGNFVFNPNPLRHKNASGGRTGICMVCHENLRQAKWSKHSSNTNRSTKDCNTSGCHSTSGW